jgi:hypothetical protein
MLLFGSVIVFERKLQIWLRCIGQTLVSKEVVSYQMRFAKYASAHVVKLVQSKGHYGCQRNMTGTCNDRGTKQ